MTNWIISSSILIITIALLRRLFRNKISLRFQYALWFLVAVRLLVPLNFGTSVISIENLTNQLTIPTQVEKTFENDHETTSVINESNDYSNAVKIYEGVEKNSPDSTNQISEEQTFRTEPAENQDSLTVPEIVPKVLFFIWITGIFISGMVFMITNLHFAKKVKRTRQKLTVSDSPLPVYLSKEVDSPCLFGVFHPCIYVTKAAAEESMTLMFSIFHEATHYRHGDLLWTLIRCMCLVIHWYNPFVWWAAKLSKQDSELACDEATIARLGESERLTYGQTLIRLTCEKRNDLFVTATTMTSEKKNITERIKFIAKKPKIRVYALICIVLVLLFTAVGVFTNTAKAKTGPEMKETQESTQNTLDSATSENPEDDASIEQPIFYEEAQNDKVCLAVMPDGISQAGGDYRYIIPEDQIAWTDAYEQMRSIASGDGAWHENERSCGIWIVYNDEWTCITDEGFLFNFSKRVQKEDAESFYSLCLAEAEKNGTGTPVRPNDITAISAATLVYDDTYTIVDPNLLSELRENFAASEEIRGGSSCPFTASLLLELQDGQVLTLYLATDSCNAWLSDGVFYDYRGYEGIDELCSIFSANNVSGDEELSYLSDPTPGTPCENPADAGWDLKNAKDIRTKWSSMPYVPEEGTENNTYLIGKTEAFTLYGKGDYETMLLECDGKYAEIRHTYASNYMTPLDLMEIDLDEDGQNELAIKFNIKHGTGMYIDTFLLADFGTDKQLYIHQFLDEDFTAQLAEHLSFEKTEKGIQPLVNGKPAGVFAENEEDMDSFSSTAVGAQMRFYYNEIKNTIQLSGEIMLLIDGYPGGLWTNYNDVTATVHWDRTRFYLTDFTSKNRSLDEQVYYGLLELYDVPNLYYVDVRYDSANMNQETLVISAEILPDENDSSYDYTEVHLKRAYTNSVSGWEIENIYLEK